MGQARTENQRCYEQNMMTDTVLKNSNRPLKQFLKITNKSDDPPQKNQFNEQFINFETKVIF